MQLRPISQIAKEPICSFHALWVSERHLLSAITSSSNIRHCRPAYQYYNYKYVCYWYLMITIPLVHRTRIHLPRICCSSECTTDQSRHESRVRANVKDRNTQFLIRMHERDVACSHFGTWTSALSIIKSWILLPCIKVLYRIVGDYTAIIDTAHNNRHKFVTNEK